MPSTLAPYIDRYLDEIRPLLLQGKQSDALWITQYGEPLSYGGVSRRLKKVTHRLFGKALSPHMFRHALATSIAIDRPALYPGSVDQGLAGLERLSRRPAEATAGHLRTRSVKKTGSIDSPAPRYRRDHLTSSLWRNRDSLCPRAQDRTNQS
jgi:hypothetical protein